MVEEEIGFRVSYDLGEFSLVVLELFLEVIGSFEFNFIDCLVF